MTFPDSTEKEKEPVGTRSDTVLQQWAHEHTHMCAGTHTHIMYTVYIQKVPNL